MKLYLEPQADLTDHGREVRARARRLHAAAGDGRTFFVLTVGDPLETALWITASFFSPLTVVPLAPNLPAAARAVAPAQLPENSWVEVGDLPAEAAIEPSPKDLQALWCVIFSSGSTGTPKGIALSGEALKASAFAHAEHSQASNATWLLDLSPAHVGGFSVLSRAHFLGAPVALGTPRFSPAQTMAWVRSGKVSGLSVVPVTLRRLLQEPFTEEDFRHLRIVLLGGAPAEDSLVEEALARGIPVRRTYGMTENASQAATEKGARSGLQALPGVTLRLSSTGEIELKSSFLARGYFRAGVLEPLPSHEGYFPTGDLGAIESGALKVNGRAVELINSGGVKVFPAEIENALAGLPGLEEAAAFGVPDAEWGEAVCVVAVGKSLSSESLRAHLESRLDRRKLPKKILLADALPRSATGKVLRAELKKLILANHGA